MIILIANAVIHEGKQAEYLAAAEPCIAATRQEPGNISYRLMADPSDGTRFSFVEEWESREALTAHMETAHYKAFGAAAQPLCAKPTEINLFSAERTK